MKDISRRVVNVLMGVEDADMMDDKSAILVADDLTPSETVQLDKSKLLGFITRHGSSNSHTAILARTMNIPALVGVDFQDDWDGKLAIIDGYNHCVYIEPAAELLATMEEKRSSDLKQQALLQSLKKKPNVTLDGKEIKVYANIGNAGDVGLVLQNDAQGIGLFRSEFIYLDSQDFPTEDQQFMLYKRVVETMAGKKVIIRTLDIGADKQADYFGLDKKKSSLGLPGYPHLPDAEGNFQDPASGDSPSQCFRHSLHHVPHGHFRPGGTGRERGAGGVQSGAEGAGRSRRRGRGRHYDRNPRRRDDCGGTGRGSGFLLPGNQRPDTIHPCY